MSADVVGAGSATTTHPAARSGDGATAAGGHGGGHGGTRVITAATTAATTAVPE